ncbi:MAG: DUF86 domain-containing protein [Planctomycetes bacterium]|nr:DUF86 domain-containing protein [Planctomycetota bacterium]
MAGDDAHILDMLMACRRVTEAIEGRSLESFLCDWKLQSVVQHQLIILGEAAKRLSWEFRDRHPDIPWAAIAGQRDILIHRYHGVDLDEVWIAATERVPLLARFLETLGPAAGAAEDGA